MIEEDRGLQHSTRSGGSNLMCMGERQSSLRKFIIAGSFHEDALADT